MNCDELINLLTSLADNVEARNRRLLRDAESESTWENSLEVCKARVTMGLCRRMIDAVRTLRRAEAFSVEAALAWLDNGDYRPSERYSVKEVRSVITRAAERVEKS